MSGIQLLLDELHDFLYFFRLHQQVDLALRQKLHHEILVHLILLRSLFGPAAKNWKDRHAFHAMLAQGGL